jgi:hypothetical protein
MDDGQTKEGPMRHKMTSTGEKMVQHSYATQKGLTRSHKKEKSAEGQISTEWKKELLNWMEEGYTRKGKDCSLRSQQVIEIKRTRVD